MVPRILKTQADLLWVEGRKEPGLLGFLKHAMIYAFPATKFRVWILDGASCQRDSAFSSLPPPPSPNNSRHTPTRIPS